MADKKLKVVWDIEAKTQLHEAYKFIQKDSLQNAVKVRDSIIAATASLSHHFVHTADKYKLNNDGSYRAFELYSYRISYRITLTEIRILRLRHTKKQPLKY
jgi:plasmid stabilization system protein ParE